MLWLIVYPHARGSTARGYNVIPNDVAYFRMRGIDHSA